MLFSRAIPVDEVERIQCNIYTKLRKRSLIFFERARAAGVPLNSECYHIALKVYSQAKRVGLFNAKHDGDTSVADSATSLLAEMRELGFARTAETYGLVMKACC